jgi:hypothetical protein
VLLIDLSLFFVFVRHCLLFCAARTPAKFFHSLYRFLFLLLEYWQRLSLVGSWSVRHLVLSLGALSSCIKVSIFVSAARRIWFCPLRVPFSVPLDFSQRLGGTRFAAGFLWSVPVRRLVRFLTPGRFAREANSAVRFCSWFPN